MGLCGGGGSSTQTTVQRTELPEWVEREGEQLYNTARPIAERPYPFYDDPRIAGLNPDQQAAFGLARNQVGSWEPSFMNAFFGYGAAGQQFNPYGQPQQWPGQPQQWTKEKRIEQPLQQDMGFGGSVWLPPPTSGGAQAPISGGVGGAQWLASPYQMAIAGPAEPFVGQAGDFAFQSGTAGTPYSLPGFAQAFIGAGTERGTEAAYGALGAGGAPISPEDMSRYFNPYVQQVQQTTIEELNRQYERDRNTRNSEMVARGSYLNEDRREVIDNLSRESRDRVIAEMMARTNAGAFNTALGAAQGDRSSALSTAPQYRGLAGDVSGRSIQALATSMGVRAEDLSRMLSAGGQFGNLAQLGAQIGAGGLDAALGTRSDDLNRLLGASGGFAQLGPQAQQMGYADVAAMLGIGGQQQQQTQSGMDLAYNEFLRQFYYPQEQTNWLTAMLSGTPYGQTTTTQQPVGSSNTLGGIFGGLASLGGAAGMLGWSPFCWVAREVYGADNPKWLVFREWMLTWAPKWLRAAYLKYGERIARWLRGKDRLKALVRKWMDSRVLGMSRS